MEQATIQEFNDFCSSLTEGTVLYNIDKTNGWGEYLMVINVSKITLDSIDTYSVLLLGLHKEGDTFKAKNLKITLTPDYSDNIPYLRCVGNCEFILNPCISQISINKALTIVYGDTDLSKFSKKLSIRKPRKRKYDKEGKLVLKKINN